MSEHGVQEQVQSAAVGTHAASDKHQTKKCVWLLESADDIGHFGGGAG